MKRYLYFFNGCNDIYNKALVESLIEELKELYPDVECRRLSGLKDLLRRGVVIVCGGGDFPGKIVWAVSVLKKPLVFYHVPGDTKYFRQLARKARWIVAPGKADGDYSYYPSSVFLSDLATPKRIGRIWRKEKLVSKRGCIGILGLRLSEGLQRRLAAILDLLVEDLDLNIIFIPVLERDSAVMQEVLSQIKFSANTRYIQAERYSYPEVLGIISRIDVLITSDARAAVCAMSANRPVVALGADEALKELLMGVVEEDILLDMDILTDEEVYTRVKIAWVHRDAIAGQMQGRINELKSGAIEGVRQLGKRGKV